MPSFVSFDEAHMAMLTPLAKRRAVLHYPFFANTFSLAFHYTNALAKDGVEWHEVRKLVREHNWDQPAPALGDGDEHIFYATRAAMGAVRESGSLSEWHVEYLPISRYRSLWLFVEYSPFIGSKFPSSPRQAFSSKLVDMAQNLRVDRIELFTDIPGQAMAITKQLITWGWQSKQIDVIEEPLDALRFQVATDRVLRLYYYGAPSTARMRRKPFGYVGLLLPDELQWGGDSTITCICRARKQIPEAKTESEDLSFLAQYHKSIFQTAKQQPFDLLNVWWAYNRLAERKQHSATFVSSHDFASCLTDHHLDPEG